MVALRVDTCPLKVAKAFVSEHHRHHKPPLNHRYSLAAYKDAELVGVAIVGRPVARAYDPTEIVEVTRVCTDGTRNACSKLYGAAAREAKRRGFKKIITYTLETEPGTSLRAVGWEREAKTKGGTWYCPSRPRTDKHPTCKKWRWGKEL